MKRECLLATSLLALAFAAPFAANAQTVYGGAQTLDGLQNRANTRGNMQLQERRDAEWRRAFRAQDLIEQQRQALHPYKPAPLIVSAEPGADTLESLAKAYRADYFKDMTQAQVSQYIRTRYAQYLSTSKARGLNPQNIASACDYLAEDLYAVGGHVDASRDRETIRGSCTLLLQQNEAGGGLKTNAERMNYLQYSAVTGGIYADLDRRYSANGDAAKRGFYARDARDIFQKEFRIDMTALPPSHFMCVFAKPPISCNVVARVYPPYLKKIAAEYP